MEISGLRLGASIHKCIHNFSLQSLQILGKLYLAQNSDLKANQCRKQHSRRNFPPSSLKDPYFPKYHTGRSPTHERAPVAVSERPTQEEQGIAPGVLMNGILLRSCDHHSTFITALAGKSMACRPAFLVHQLLMIGTNWRNPMTAFAVALPSVPVHM